MLYICPTPIGNLGDMTFRTLDALNHADIIACEDTRVTGKLLHHFDIKKKLISYREHNEQTVSEKIIDYLKEGKNVALVSDAGMPGISDPGEILIKKMIAEELDYTVLPGASAVITALVASNQITQPFYYHGFLDRKKGLEQLEQINKLPASLIFYESPHRLLKTLELMQRSLGNRQMSIMRELTKKFESYYHGSIDSMLDYFTQNPPKGEFVLIVSGYTETKKICSFDDVVLIARERIHNGERQKDVVKELAKTYHMDRQALYKATL